MSSQLIQTRNVQTYYAQKTFLTDGINVDGQTLPVMNNNGAVANWVAHIGEPGSEKAEVQKIASVGSGGTSVTLSGSARFQHPENTPVYWIKYDQIIFERSTSGTAGTATPITNGTITITPDSDVTQFDDTSGDTSYAYKTAYYNSALSATSPESDWITPGGFSSYSLAKIKETARKRMKRQISDDDLLDDWVDEWREDFTMAAVNVNKDYSMGTVDIAFTASQIEGTISANDFYQPRSVWYIDSSGTYPAARIPFNQYDPNTTQVAQDPFFYLRGDNVIGRLPSTNAGTIRIHYYSSGNVLNSDADTLPLMLRPYRRACIDYLLFQEADLDGRDTEAQVKESRVERQKSLMVSQLADRDKSGNSQVRMVEDVY